MSRYEITKGRHPRENQENPVRNDYRRGSVSSGDETSACPKYCGHRQRAREDSIKNKKNIVIDNTK